MEKKVKVGMVQISESFGLNEYYFPYSVGILQAYALRHLGDASRYEFLIPVYKQLSPEDVVQQMKGVDIVFFSSYMWNHQRNLVMARNIRIHYPTVKIVFGGPQIPEQKEKMEAFLRKNPFIDLGCCGEGEIPFLRILESFTESRWDEVPSIGYLTPAGQCMINPAEGRIKHLDDIPSPYLEGVFDRLIQENPDVSWSAMWESNRGCPFSCAFCAWGAADKKKVYHFDLKKLFKEIDWFSAKEIDFVFCCDANFGLFSRDLEIVHKVAENKKLFGFPRVFSVQNTKNSTDRIIALQKILHEAGLQKGVNLAFQSLNPQTLSSIHRTNIKSDFYRHLQQHFSQARIPTFSDIIIGLPEETYDSLVQGITDLIENGQYNKIQFINLAVLENTAMADSDYQKKYGMILRETKMVSHHSTVNEREDTFENQILVVGTKTMPKDDWVKSRIFCWMLSLFHFHKLLQIPFVFLNRVYGVSYRKLVDAFMLDSPDYPCLSEIYTTLKEKARAIQKGDPEYIPSKEWLNIWWPIEEYLLIRLTVNDMLSTFYHEADYLLSGLMNRESIPFQNDLVQELLVFNRHLIKRPLIHQDLDLLFQYNVYDVYAGILMGRKVPLKKGRFSYRIDRSKESWPSLEDWFRNVIWYGAKKGDYFYPCLSGDKDISVASTKTIR